MSIVKMSPEAYKDFKGLLDDNKVENNTVRIIFAGMACSGPMFNLTIDEKKENDEVITIEEATILVDKQLVSEFGGFTVTCESENGMGLFIEPVIKPEGGGCASCGGGCH